MALFLYWIWPSADTYTTAVGEQRQAKLEDVAGEFNRYNRTKIQIKGDAAQEILLTGIFDADRPHVLMLYAAKNDALVVEPDGKNWVIRAR